MPVKTVGTQRYAVGLYRVSTAEQGHSGLGLEAQQASVRALVGAQGWILVAEFSDIASGKDDRRPAFQAALTRCRQIGAVLAAARLDRITRRAHTLSQLLEDGYSIRAADMPGADDLMMRIYAAMAQKECELISERTRAALAAAKARGARLGGDRGYRLSVGPDSGAAASSRRVAAERAATGYCWKWTGCVRKVFPRVMELRGRLRNVGFPRRVTARSGHIRPSHGCWREQPTGIRPRRSEITCQLLL
jgi:DNA invertase Pin-like site-specific DNA recombinase